MSQLTSLEAKSFNWGRVGVGWLNLVATVWMYIEWLLFTVEFAFIVYDRVVGHGLCQMKMGQCSSSDSMKI